MVAVYSVLQMIRCLCVQSASSIPPSSALSWTIFMFDQLMTYLLLSVSAASAQSAWFAEQGSEGFKWAKVCYLYEKFCQQVGSGMFGAFVACLALAITSVISAFSLFANGDYVQ
ncbi:hypothetical protein KP509_02G018700 [Ceratopteris richardii]|nr:hypothetical protein KP509_02G018700 [Ceratopteris richardii]